jgi:hypothetical protein
MAQAWHTPREQLGLAQHVESKCWRASKYELVKHEFINNHRQAGTEVCIEATSDAQWGRISPFDLYRPTSKVREVEAGPHLAFLMLKGLWEAEAKNLDTAWKVFATEFGLLGVFEEEYYWPPVFPHGKIVIAPEAVIDSQGKLQRVDPATEGKEIVWNALAARGRYLTDVPLPAESKYTNIALPSELEFIAKGPFIDNYFWPAVPHRQPVTWEEIKEDLGVLLILDEESYTGVSVLCTREPLQRWRYSLAYFPSGDMAIEHLLSDSFNDLNWRLRQVSPYLLLGKDGNLKRGWSYRSLLQAMYVMLWLDLTGDNTVKKCQSRGCPNYFRVGSQSNSKYCSTRCANLASTRMGRGQEP